ncbi:phasin family protein [Denitromonas iodatirespirans]|uniref:Phasin family protein n=1 Tax=Denitromonas iodatirespirans TaxID=2795389 RepID=A0A944HBB6_DENI1|nr:phasin family protein [Denitromonas iodatirespirans]MBT0961492.1 phasin family protein [Denitromonas iodatirespirans]
MSTMNYMEKVTEVANGNGKVVKSIFDLSLQAMRDLGTLNGELIHALADEAKAPASADDLGEQIRLQARQIEKGSDYFRNVNEVLMKTQAEIGKLQIRRMSDLFETFSSQIGQLVPQAGSDPAKIADTFKDSMAQTSEAYEKMFSLSRDLLDNSVKAFLNTPQAVARRASAPAAAKKMA